MISKALIVLPALLAFASAKTCSVILSDGRGQDPVVGGSTTHQCGLVVDYGDGSPQDLLSSECNKIWHVSGNDQCFPSKLPYTICIHQSGGSNGEIDGYINYAAEHMDFNQGGKCHRASTLYFGIGDEHSIVCSFAC